MNDFSSSDDDVEPVDSRMPLSDADDNETTVESELQKVHKVSDAAFANTVYFVDWDASPLAFNKFKTHLFSKLSEPIELVYLKQFENETVDKFIEETLGDILFYPSIFCGCRMGMFRLEGELSRRVYNIQRLIFIQ